MKMKRSALKPRMHRQVKPQMAIRIADLDSMDYG